MGRCMIFNLVKLLDFLVKLFSFLSFIILLISLAWILKNKLNVGDEVIAGISGALITLLGVYLTNINNQKTLDKQLNQQRRTFNIQLNEQAKLLNEQIKHQAELLATQLEHQSNENLKNRIYNKKENTFFELILCANKFFEYIHYEVFSRDSDDSEIKKIYNELNSKIIACQFVCDRVVNEFLEELKECCKDSYYFTLKEKTSIIKIHGDISILEKKADFLKTNLNDYSEVYQKGGLSSDDYNEKTDKIILEFDRNGEEIMKLWKHCNEEILKIIIGNQDNYKKYLINIGKIMELANRDLGFGE